MSCDSFVSSQLYRLSRLCFVSRVCLLNLWCHATHFCRVTGFLNSCGQTHRLLFFMRPAFVILHRLGFISLWFPIVRDLSLRDGRRTSLNRLVQNAVILIHMTWQVGGAQPASEQTFEHTVVDACHTSQTPRAKTPCTRASAFKPMQI